MFRGHVQLMKNDGEPIKSLHINTERTWRGGEQQVFYLVDGLARRGQPVTMVCQAGTPLHERAEELPVDVVPMRVRGEIDIMVVFGLRNIIRDRGIDIVHMHSPHAHTLGCAAAVLARSGRCVVTRRVDFSTRKSLLSALKYRWKVDRYIAISHAIKGVMVNDGIDGSRISVVYSGIEPGRFRVVEPCDIRAELGFEPGTPLIGNVAHMADHKGQRYLVDAMPIILDQLPAARLVIAGSGELYDELVGQVARLGIGQSVRFLGFRNDIPALLKSFDVFAMSSHMEGLCTAILDAMACGVPVVATRVGGIPEIITDGENGLLVPRYRPPDRGSAVYRRHDGRW